MGYVIAAYVIVIGSLVAYGLWIQSQRRALMRGERERELASRDADAPPS